MTPIVFFFHGELLDMQSQNGAALTCGIPSSATFVAKGNYGTADAMIGLDATCICTAPPTRQCVHAYAAA